MKFMKCESCGNIIEYVDDKGIEIYCCGEEMNEIVPNSGDASKEKHIPVVEREGNKVTVTVGEVPHPMEAAHSIEWIVLETKSGSQRKNITSKNSAEFYVSDDDEVLGAYAYCNLHGLWKA